MLSLLFDHSPAFIIAELLFGLAVATFVIALVGAVREKFANVPLARIRNRFSR